MRGVCTFHSETGTEGGYWAFQDEQFIEPPTKDMPSGRWSYDGLHLLEDGDQLTIYSKGSPRLVEWSGIIQLHQYPLFSEDASGMWIHADQVGVNRDWWAKFFFEDYAAEYTPKAIMPE